MFKLMLIRMAIFQSTSPAGDDSAGAGILTNLLTDFNPHLPQEMTLLGAVQTLPTDIFQSTSPAGDDSYRYCLFQRWYRDFNPHLPQEMTRCVTVPGLEIV